MAVGDSLEVDTQATPVDGWVTVSTKAGTGYVSSDYVDVSIDYGTAITIEEEQAAIAAAKAAEEAKKIQLESMLQQLLNSGMSTDEILDKLK